jgi:hypothetical protein
MRKTETYHQTEETSTYQPHFKKVPYIFYHQRQSQKHEKRLAKKVGGTRTAASGAFWSRKGDVRSKELLIEHKWTGKKQVTIKSEVLKKITREAILDNRIPVLGLHLDGENYVVLLEDDYLEMRETVEKES